MSKPTVAGIILAAGKGTRMKSDMPKVLHEIGGLHMVELVGRALREAGVERPIVVIGHRGEMVQDALGDEFEYVWQTEQRGTGHAALMAEQMLREFDGPVLVAPGDAPLLSGEVFEALLNAHRRSGAACTMLTAKLEDPTGYGRVIRDAEGKAVRVVEQKDGTPIELEISEVNVSVYCFDARELYKILPTLGNDNRQGEYYLTDTVAAFSKAGKCVETVTTDDPGSLVGVNDRWQLALAEAELNARILRRHALAGVTLVGHSTIRIEPDVEIEPDAKIVGPCQIEGQTKIGARAEIGPSTRIVDSTVGARTIVLMSHVTCASIGDDVWIGPFANLRPGSVIGNSVRIGNFVETKNSTLADEAKVSHLSYIGDARVGSNANIGGGVITANFDGFVKSTTTIGADAFVGSNSTLIAPVTIGEGAMVVAGSVITDDVPPGAGAFARSRQTTKPEWAKEWRRKKHST